MSEPTRGAFGANILKNLEAGELRQARGILVVMGLLTVVSQGLLYGKIVQAEDAVRKLGTASQIALLDKLRYAAIAGIGVGVVFLVCAALVYRKPLLATITGLGLYLGMIVIQALIDPSTLWGDVFGTGVRIAVLIGLGSAVQFARIYERNRRARDDFPKASIVKT